MTTTIQVDTADAEAYLDGIWRDQIPFAASLAVNQTAKDVQAAERGDLAGEFILRRPDFIFRGVKIPRFSNKADQVIAAEIVIDEKTDFLRKFEAGTPKESIAGKQLAIPIAARPARGEIVPQQLRPRELQLRVHRTASDKVQLKGKFGTFAIRGLGIFQRVEGKVRLLYLFRRVAHTPAILRFVEVGQQIVAENWPKNFAAAFARAIKTAR